MSIDPALTAPELAALAGPSTTRRFLSVVPLTVVGTATVSSVPSGYEIAQVSYTGQSAGWSNVRAGMTVVFTSAGGVLRGTYRVRRAPSGGVLTIGETGLYDPGQYPLSDKTATFAVGDTITVYNRYDLWTVLPRILYPGTGLDATFYEDYDEPVGTKNITPEVIVNIIARDSKGNRGRHISTLTTGTGDAMSFAASVIKWAPSAASDTSYAWTVPDSWTDVNGENTATLTATVPVGHHVLVLTVTDSVGGICSRVVNVWVHNEETYPPLYVTGIASDTTDRTGRRITFTRHGQGMADIPDGAMVNYWADCTWNGEVPGNHTLVTQAPGWLLRYRYTADSGLVQAEPELVGPSHVLSMLGGYSQYFERKTTPTSWQELAPLLSTLHFCLFHMMRWRCANLLTLFNYTPADISAASARMPVFKVNGNNLLAQLQNLAQSYFRGNFGCDSYGNFWHRRHPSLYWLDVDRNAVPTRITLDETQVESVRGLRELMPRVRKVRGEAFANDGAAILPTPYLSDAPSAAPGQGASDLTVESQIVDVGQAELNFLTGNVFALENNPYPEISVKIPKHWPIVSPAHMPWVQLNIDGAYFPTGETLSSRCVPTRILFAHNEDGTVDTTIELEAETRGGTGVTVPVPEQKPNVYVPPTFPPPYVPPPVPPEPPEPPVIPGDGGEMKTNGSFVLTCTEEGSVIRTFNFLDDSPEWQDISPSGAATTFTQVLFDPATNYNRGAYVLGNDGTYSYVYHTANVGAATVTWYEGVGLPGVYTKLAAFRDMAGHILVYNPDVGAGDQELDYNVTFDVGGDAYAFETVSPSAQGQVLGGGNPDNCGGVESPAQPGNAAITRIRVSLPAPATITAASLDYKKDYDSTITYNSPLIIGFDPPEPNYEVIWGQRLSSGGRTTAGVMNGTNSGTYREVNLRIPVYVPSGVQLSVVFYCKGTQTDPGIFRMATTWTAYDASDNDLGIGLGLNNAYTKDTWHAFGQLYFPTTPAAVAYIIVRVWVSTQAYAGVAYCYMDDITITATGAYQESNIQLVRTVQLLDAADGLIATVINESSQPANATWFTDSASSLSHTNVKSALFTVSASGSPGALSTYLDNATLEGSYGSAGIAQVAYSSNHGGTFSALSSVGTAVGAVGGFDAARFGPASFGAALSQIKRATTLGGAYSNLTGGAVTARSIVVPWWRVGSISATNYSTDADILAGGAFGLRSIVGGSPTDITPSGSGTVAVADAITLWKGRRIACLLDESGDRNLYVTTDTGANWTLVGGANGAADARSVRVRRLANTPGQLVIAAGSNGILYYPGSGTSLIDKGAPAGTYTSAEFFG